jgi:hypothetical protein
MRMIYFEDLKVGDSWQSSEHSVDGLEMLAYNRTRGPSMLTLRPLPSRRTVR